MIDFLLKAAGLLAVLLTVFVLGNMSALATIRSEAPELYQEWTIIHNERKGQK